MQRCRTTTPPNERGASATEYALIVALMVVATLAAISSLSSAAETVLIQTGDDVGTPRAPRGELLSTP